MREVEIAVRVVVGEGRFFKAGFCAGNVGFLGEEETLFAECGGYLGAVAGRGGSLGLGR